MNSENVIEIKNFTKKYKNFLIENMNLNVKKGYITGFIGRNGAGKSTTIKSILNITPSYSGEIEILNTNMKSDEIMLKNRIGVVLGEGFYFEDISIKSFINIISPMYSNWDMELFKEYMDKFSLPFNQKISSLSKGMRVKLSIALALSHNADLFLLDEPTAGLDPIVRDEILDIFQGIISDPEKTVFFSTHITSDLDKIADFIVFIDNGKILLNEAKDELIERHILVKGDKFTLNDDIKNHLIGYKENKYGFEALSDNRDFLNGINNISLEKPNIEDIMLYYTKN